MEGESMSEWKEVRLGDVSTINAGGDAPRGNMSKVKNEKFFIPIYSNGIDNQGLYGFTNKAIIDRPACTITARGTIGVVFNRKEPYYPIVRLISVIADESIIKNDFLYYLLRNTRIKGDGSVQEQFTVPMAKDINLKIPTSIENQDQITGILSSLDAKIETNNKLNEKLEEMAQAIFKSWFVDFEPFKDKPFHETELGMIPEGWEVVSLTDIATFTNGLAMQKFRPNYKEPHLPVLKIKELRQGFCDDTSEICIDDISDNFIAYNGDIIFSWSGTLLVDIWCGGKCGVNQHLFKVTSEKYNKWFFYFWIKRHLAEFIRIAKDKAVTMGHIKRGHLTNALVVVPNEKTMQNADKIFTPIIDRIIEAKIESKRLASLRDTLLPRLMSGELIV